MRIKLLLLAVFCSAQMVFAKDYEIVIRRPDLSVGHTEVDFEPGTQLDTISVVPSCDATAIYVTLRDTKGTVLQQYCLDALRTGHISIISPSLPEGYYLEVCDDRGVAYTKYEN